jgi:hypothetical protein
LIFDSSNSEEPVFSLSNTLDFIFISVSIFLFCAYIALVDSRASGEPPFGSGAFHESG